MVNIGKKQFLDNKDYLLLALLLPFGMFLFYSLSWNIQKDTSDFVMSFISSFSGRLIVGILCTIIGTVGTLIFFYRIFNKEKYPTYYSLREGIAVFNDELLSGKINDLKITAVEDGKVEIFVDGKYVGRFLK